MVGLEPARAVKSEPTGLRLTLPAEKTAEPTGVKGDFRIKGDFEATVSYEIVNPVGPKENSVAGFDIYLVTDSINMEAVAFKRSIWPDGREEYGCARMTTDMGRRQDTYKGKREPAKGNSGQLRIVRVGSKLSLSVQEENAEKFRVVHRVHLGDEDVNQIRLAASSFGSGTAYDVRVRDFRIRCADADAIKLMDGAKK